MAINFDHSTDTISTTGGTLSLTGYTPPVTPEVNPDLETDVNNTTPNATTTVLELSPVATTTDMDIAIVPNGTGAILADVPDNTSTGGEKRGDYAVDLQLVRDANWNVASGAYSALVGGRSNTPSGTYSAIIGGRDNSANSSYSAAIGGYDNAVQAYAAFGAGSEDAIVNGSYSAVIGTDLSSTYGNYTAAIGGYKVYTSTNSRYGISTGYYSKLDAYCAINIGSSRNNGVSDGYGNSGTTIRNISARTTDNTATKLLAFNSDVNGTNLYVPSDYVQTITGTVVCARDVANEVRAWEVKIVAKNTGTLSIVNTVIDDLGYDSGLSGVSIAVSADTTNGWVEIEATGLSAAGSNPNCYWNASLIVNQQRFFG
jgi:hypothetical protein